MQLLCFQSNSCSICVKGYIHVLFNDVHSNDSNDNPDNKYKFTLPQLHIEGLLWGPRRFMWRGHLSVEGPRLSCTLTVGGGPHGGPLDEVYGQVESMQEAGGPHSTDEGEKGLEASKVEGIVTGSYVDRLFWNDDE